VRQLVRDFPYFARAVNIIVDYVVGAGIVYQARVQDGSGKLDRKTNQRIEDVFARWADEADISGKLHFYELMRLAKRQDVESGEFLLVKTRSDDRRRYLPFCLQAYEADWLASNTLRDVASGNEVEQGIEYNAATGRVAAFHFTDPDTRSANIRVPGASKYLAVSSSNLALSALSAAFFDTQKAGCLACAHNSDVQKKLLAVDQGEKTVCTSPACFRQKQNTYLLAHWAGTPLRKKYRTNGFCFDEAFDWGKHAVFYKKANTRIPMRQPGPYRPGHYGCQDFASSRRGCGHFAGIALPGLRNDRSRRPGNHNSKTQKSQKSKRQETLKRSRRPLILKCGFQSPTGRTAHHHKKIEIFSDIMV